ncbi:hypothetical protein EUTSA_v10004496mg [Eutrema salsugineum]|uniref:TF-B3 domain-containing protein n=2 Tax=Eutrema salsugineum TaxID=72664 RepID=V4KUZ7_EUTSA|nr:hypothetical protein EUTSA_v10004496mg [Eutrema salsugineum]
MVESGEKVSPPSSSQPKDLEFFKVFLPEFSARELEIPTAFIDILEKPIPKQVLLVDEIGRLWGVETKAEERNRLVVFQKGWERFANDQSLEFGDFLVFSYDGDSRFSVSIFAKEGCKKDLGVVSTNRVSVEKGPVAVEPADISTNPGRRERRGKRVNLNRKRDLVKEKPSVRAETEPQYVSTIKTEPDYVPAIKTEPKHRENTLRKVNRSRDPCGISWVPKKKHKGFEESEYKPKNPHFVRNITSGSLRQMEIPTTFLKSNGIDMEKDIELCDENGKKWPLKIVNHCSRGLKFSYDSWLLFSQSHKLRRPDKCLFEFIVTSDGRCNQVLVRILPGRLLTTVSKNRYQVLAM